MKNRFVLLTLILVSSVLVLILLSVCLGPVKINLGETIAVLFTKSTVKQSTAYIITNLRLPRALCAVFAGAVLALSGLIFQCVFRNPMADSYVLGISSGASCSVALGLLLGLNLTSSISLPVIAFTGSIVTALFLFSTSNKNAFSLLLSGIAVNFFLSALTTLFVDLGHGTVDAVLYWTMGSLANTNYLRVSVIGVITVLLFTIIRLNSTRMDILLLDDSTAISSGIDIGKSRFILLLIASAATSIVVSYCGVIGFVGLMSPHIARLLCGPKHKRLALISMLLGSFLLLLSDLIAKTIAAPSELPVGIVTSILGAPLFFIMLRRKRSWIK